MVYSALFARVYLVSERFSHMFNRNFLLAAVVSIAASLAAFAQGPGTGYIFQVPGASSSSAQLAGYIETANPLTAAINTSGPAGVFKIIAKPDGSKFYLLGSSGANALQSVDSTFTNFKSINGIGTAPTAAALTPDGKFLLVGADAFYIIDTSTDAIVGGAGIPLPSGLASNVPSLAKRWSANWPR